MHTSIDKLTARAAWFYGLAVSRGVSVGHDDLLNEMVVAALNAERLYVPGGDACLDTYVNKACTRAALNKIRQALNEKVKFVSIEAVGDELHFDHKGQLIALEQAVNTFTDKNERLVVDEYINPSQGVLNALRQMDARRIKKNGRRAVTGAKTMNRAIAQVHGVQLSKIETAYRKVKKTFKKLLTGIN